MSLSAFRDSARRLAQRALKAARDAPGHVRRKLKAVDLFVQDHHVAATALVLMLILAGAGALFWFRLDEVVEFARTYAPVATILSITVGTLLGVTKWFRKRRAARLALAAADTGPCGGEIRDRS
ncbi:hypothetical protein [Streptomyces sp. NPDC013457]|uniref:hypothetical protein n=1 Tax=Streptomyces sp. NPDC013457 TaxID=3364866 RepID=UPI0036FB9E1D